MTDERFPLALALAELHAPFDQALAAAREIGARYLFVNAMRGTAPGSNVSIGEMSDSQADAMAARVASHDLTLMQLGTAAFKEVHLAELDLAAMTQHDQFRQHLDGLIRTLQVAARLGVPAVTCFAFAWPGEYGVGAKSTWPMRWATRGGIISNHDLDKLEKAFTLMLEQAERYDVALRVMQMAWNYTNTTGNFRRIAERLGSPRRLRLMWCPADNYNSGELDVASVGLRNVLPYVDALHVKDLSVHDGPNLGFDYRLVGDGDVDYAAILRGLHQNQTSAYLSVASHFVAPGDDRKDPLKNRQWLQTNFATVRRLAEQVLTE